MELKEKVATLIAEVDKTHQYSMSRIYGLYNEVFGLAEVPQSCASCLIRKVNQLKTWLNEQPQPQSIPQPTEEEEEDLHIEKEENKVKASPKKRGRKPKQD